MGRNRGFTAALIQIQREAELQARAQEAASTRAAREAERARRAYERSLAVKAKEDGAWRAVGDVPSSRRAEKSRDVVYEGSDCQRGVLT
jgi:hypothetical protein